MAIKFREVPVITIVEAIKWDGSADTANTFIGEAYGFAGDWTYCSAENTDIIIPCVGIHLKALIGDYIVKDSKGNFSIYPPEIFESIYVLEEAASCVTEAVKGKTKEQMEQALANATIMFDNLTKIVFGTEFFDSKPDPSLKFSDREEYMVKVGVSAYQSWAANEINTLYPGLLKLEERFIDAPPDIPNSKSRFDS